MKKAQTAVEFLTTYGWVLVGLIILLAVLLYYGAFDPLRFVPRQCTFEPGLPCTSHKLEINQTTGTIRVITQLSNDLGYDISLPDGAMLIQVENIGKPGKNTYVGNCSPKAPYIIKKGGSFTCIVEIPDKEVIPQMGKNVRLQADLVYRNCLTDPNYLQTGNCTLASNYTSEGTAVTPVEGFSPTLYCGDGICGSSIGENPTICAIDCPPPASITINASPSLVAPDGVHYSNITATVRDKNHNPMRSMEVVFTSTPIGKLSSYSAVTDSNGIARVTLTSSTAGVATVTAIAAILSNSTTVSFYYVPSTIALSHSLTAPCSNTSQITATVMDQQGNLIKDMQVIFSHNANGIASFTPGSALTDDMGQASTTFYDSMLNSERVRVNATLYMPDLGITLRNSTVLDYTPSSIVLTSTRDPFPCGNDFLVKAHIEDKYGNAVCDYNVSFSHNASGTANLNPASNKTDSSGDTTSIFSDDKIEDVNVTGKVTVPELGLSYRSSKLVNRGMPVILLDDWVVDTTIECHNVTLIPTDASINITNGGRLTLKCMNLTMNMSSDWFHESNGLYINSGGTLITRSDGGCPVNISAIAPDPPGCGGGCAGGFVFIAERGSTFDMSGAYVDFAFKGASGIILKTDFAKVQNSTITRLNGYGISFGGTAYDDFQTNGCTISGNTIYNVTNDAIRLEQYSQGCTVSNNTIYATDTGIRIAMSGPYPWNAWAPYTSRVGLHNLRDNIIYGSDWIRMTDIGSVGSHSQGIAVGLSSYNTITNNTIGYCSIGIGVSSGDNTISLNKIYNSTYNDLMTESGDGMQLSNSNSTVNSNTISNSEYYGVRCSGNTLGSSFSANVFSGNMDDCDDCPNCYVSRSTCGTITENIILTADLINSSTCITFGADNITLDCNGHSISWCCAGFPGEYYAIYANGKNNIEVKNCVLRGYPGSIAGYSDAVYLQFTNNSKIHSNVIHSFTGIGSLDYAGAILLKNSNGNSIYNNTLFNQSGTVHMFLVSSQNNLIYDNILYNGTSSSVNLIDSDGNSLLRNTIRNSNAGISLVSSSYNRMESNSLYNNKRGIYLQQLSDSNMILSNRISNISDPYREGAVGLIDSSNNTFRNNTIYNTTFYGINILDASCKNFIFNNTITKTFTGINMSTSEDLCNNIISNTTISDTTYGVYLGMSYNASVVNSTITNNVYGIYCDLAYPGTIRNNTISGNSHTGILFNESTMTVSLNKVLSNTLWGVNCNTTDFLKPTFSQNTIQNNRDNSANANCGGCNGCPG
ncbi:MAG: hypothetical protein Sv326_0228 [Candidatus Fermentimicrarchaeum limneticum]|uniref:Big-1 domain-containing protein n=1 Tax=Fermentimicrarchaeum limneticum TaxID=2795018 RepID=A0A7D6BQ17_FERL1|nr:MAG: hypothetical protein Sv326_0228 [Candidatus Fermentimicrarchaeum limneticum]